MKTLLYAAFLTLTSLANAQSTNLTVNSRINLPEASADGASLVSSLNQLMNSLQVDIDTNKWIYPPQRLETAVLLDEIKHLAEDEKDKAKLNCRPHLTNVIPLSGERYFIQLAYIGMDEGVPVILANVELIAHKTKHNFLFSSPLARNTKGWKSRRIGNMTFHYRGVLNVAKAKEYYRLAASFDRRLDSAPMRMSFYFFEDNLEAQQALGLPYKLEYNGEGGSSGWGAKLANEEIYLMSQAKFDGFDPHDLWHNRMSKVVPRREVNHAVDEGIATLYGGCWGLTWDEFFDAFQEKIDVSEGTDWLDFRAKKVSFQELGHSNPTDFMINALFVKKIEREKGFAGVWDLLNAKEEEAYFSELTRLTGITKQNYNVEVWKLLEEEIDGR